MSLSHGAQNFTRASLRCSPLLDLRLLLARPTTRSQPPPPARGATSNGAAPGDVAFDLRTYVESLAQRFTASMSDEERAVMVGALSDEEARKLGASVGATELARECCRCLDLCAPWIVSERLQGFGPLGARFMVDLLASVAPRIVDHALAGPATPAKPAAAPRASPRAPCCASRARPSRS